MQTIRFEEVVDKIVARDPRYHRDAYQFVREALEFTQETVHKKGRADLPKKDRHVSPKQLLDGLREFALREFGPMTLMVLAEWGVRRTEDFGEIVFNLVDSGNGALSKKDEDSREDFRNGYDFEDVFRKPFLPAGQGTVKAVEETKASEV